MTASESTSPERENVTEEQSSNRYRQEATGTAWFESEVVAGQFDDAPVLVWVQRDVMPGRVCFSTIYENDRAKIEVMADLSPEQAREFGKLLIEYADEEELR